MQNSHRQIAIIIVVIFTLLQLIVLLLFNYTPYPDSDGYIFLAEECIANHDWYPISTKLNDYPFLWNIGTINAIVISLKLFHSIIPLLVVYCIMKGLTAGLLYQVTLTIINKKIAFITLILYVIYPANYGEGTSTLSELPFMFFIMLGIYLSLVKNKSIAGGMMLAIANWFRPMGIVFLLALLLCLLFKWRKSIKLLIGYVGMIVIIGTTTMYRTGLFLYQAKTGWMALMDYSSNHSHESMMVRERADWNVCQKDSAWQSLFIDWVKDHPKEYIAQMPSKLVNTYVSDNVNMCTFIPDKQDTDYMYDKVSMGTLINSFPRLSAVQWLTILNLFVYFALLVTSVVSLFYFRRDTYLLPVNVIVLGTLLLLFVGHGETRFHILFMPFFMILSSMFIEKYIDYE